MKKVPPPVAIPQPPAPPVGLAADVVASGLPVHPADRVRLFSADQWERFVQEWVDSLREEYELIERCGGAGDMGRDVIATVAAAARGTPTGKKYEKAIKGCLGEVGARAGSASVPAFLARGTTMPRRSASVCVTPRAFDALILATSGWWPEWVARMDCEPEVAKRPLARRAASIRSDDARQRRAGAPTNRGHRK